jgi:uncharacterized protein (TIGR03084 family)
MTIAEAQYFFDESRKLHNLLAQAGSPALTLETGFKHWTPEQVITHLHIWNKAALFSLTNRAGFDAFMGDMGTAIRDGGMASAEKRLIGDLSGTALLNEWIGFAGQLAEVAATRDPAERVKWVGPDMSVRSSITARLMESWAHGQAIYDVLGIDRIETDAIRGIAVLGVNTFGWTFAVRKQAAPEPKPFVDLIAPSGEHWTFGDDTVEERIEGSAVEFCRVVTQTRNVADTSLRITGSNASLWMANAQCFAGPPQPPPAPGQRRKGGTA